MRLNGHFLRALIGCGTLFLISGCAHQRTESWEKAPQSPEQEELDFVVHNATKKVLYVSCFFYRKKEDFTRWAWDKSDIYCLEPGEDSVINIDTIPDHYDRKETYGYLALFEDEEAAQDSTYENTDDCRKIDLDLLYLLQGKTVVIQVERYGFKGERFEPKILARERQLVEYPKPELDFIVENKTGKTLLVSCFVYEKKKDDPVWKFAKTPIITLKQGEAKFIDVDTIASSYDYNFIRGELAVFDEGEEEEIHDITYELLKPENKIKLGALFALRNKKIVLEIERYGVKGDYINYTTKAIRKIDFKNFVDQSRKKIRDKERVGREQPQGRELQLWR